MTRKPILCIDFDGVLHGYESGWKGAHRADDPPVAGAMEFLHEATKHFTVAVYSSRSKSPRGRWCMQAYARKHFNTALTFSPDHSWDFLYEELRWPWFKPSAFFTIDDRAMTFEGTWPSIQTIKDFKPWNKRTK